MAESFKDLTKRIHANDPELTPQALEKLIAASVGEQLTEVIKNIQTNTDALSLRQAIWQKFAMDCQIIPEMLLYVDIGDTKKRSKITPFSSQLFEETLHAIMKKDFTVTKPEEIIQLIGNAIDESCYHFLEAIVLSNAILLHVLERFTQTFGMNVTFFPKSAIVIGVNNLQPTDEETYDRPGQYL